MKKIICIVCCLLFVGCATITIDGRPIAKHVYSQRNPDTGMRVDFLFVRYKEVKEGKEKFELPVYLELNKLEKIPSNTKRIGIVIQIVNPHEVKYILELWCNTYNRKKLIDTVRQRISKSQYSNRMHEVNLSMKKHITYKYFLRLINWEGEQIMDMGNAVYYVELDYMDIINEYFKEEK